jgi:hypothetical protein
MSDDLLRLRSKRMNKFNIISIIVYYIIWIALSFPMIGEVSERSELTLSEVVVALFVVFSIHLVGFVGGYLWRKKE